MRDRSDLKKRLLKRYEAAIEKRLAQAGDKILNMDEIEAIALEVGAEMEEALAQELSQEEAEVLVSRSARREWCISMALPWSMPRSGTCANTAKSQYAAAPKACALL